MTVNINLSKEEIDKLYKELKESKYSDGYFGFHANNTRLVIYNPKLLTDSVFINIINKYGIKLS